jgi:hypothetical protein
MEKYNPFTGKTRLEAEESGEEVFPNVEKDVSNISNISSSDKEPLLSEAKKIIAEKKSALDSENYKELADYEKKWAKNSQEPLDAVHPSKNVFQQEIIEKPTDNEAVLTPEPAVIENTKKRTSLTEKIGKYSKVGLAALAFFGAGSTAEANAKGNKNIDAVANHEQYNQNKLHAREVRGSLQEQNKENISKSEWRDAVNNGIHEEKIDLEDNGQITFKFDKNKNIVGASFNIPNDQEYYLGGKNLLKDDYFETLRSNIKNTQNLSMARDVIENRAKEIFFQHKVLEKLTHMKKANGPEANFLNKHIAKIIKATKTYGDLFK